MNLKGKLYIVVAGLVLFGACATPPPASRQEKTLESAPSYSELKLKELRDLSNTDPARGLEAIAALLDTSPGDRPAGGPSDTELKTLATGAESSIETDYNAALSAKDYPKALVKLDSLRAIAGSGHISALLSPAAAAVAASWKANRTSIFSNEAEDFFSKGQAVPALLAFIAALDTDGTGCPSFSKESLSLWAHRALEAHDRRSLRRLCAELAARTTPLPEGAEAFLAAHDSMAVMRKGVVTIRVDRGIRIEQGLGVPDRVLGTAFFIDRSGYAITNYHVISSEVDPTYKGYSHMSVKPADSPEDRIGAKVIGYDRLLDIALIKVDMVPDYVFSISDDVELAPGQKIYAIGSPAGLENTITSGIVSAVGRKIMQMGSAIQVDAALNPGNSGGPLLDEAGDVLGVVCAGMPEFQNLNFAIPSEWILRILPALFQGGEVHGAWLGLSLAEKEEGPIKPGIEVTYRHPSVAAGIEEGDRLLDINGASPKDIPAAQALLLGYGTGALSLVRIKQDGKERVLLRDLTERPFSPLESAVRLDRRDRLFPALYGMALTPLPGNVFEPDNYSVAKIWPGSVADESGLSTDDPISLKRFYVDREQRAVFIQIYVKKRKAGFLESIFQIGASLDTPDFV
jgi:S1-C subfamily serine protease